MRRPICSATLPTQAQKPKFSQRPGPQGFTVRGMSRTLHPGRKRQTQGIALVVVLLSAMILMVSLLAISATMTISSQRTTADQSVTLPAQYAAEAGVARATANLAEIDGVMRQINVTNSTRTQIEANIRNYCNGTTPNFSPTAPNNEICKVGSGNLSNRYSIFSTYVPNTAYPTGTTASTYWTNVFGVSSASAKISKDAASGSEAWYTVSYKNDTVTPAVPAGPLRPTRVLLAGRNSYQFEFTVSPARSDGEIRAGNHIVATRSIEKQTGTNVYSLNVQLPTFARNFVFRDVTTSLTGGQLYFAGGESFGGPVHTNGTPGLAKVNGTTPIFTDDFSSCAARPATSGYSGSSTDYTTPDMKNTFQGSTPQFNVDPCIDLPKNSNNQKRASFGGDASNPAPLTDEEMQAAWGVRYTSTTTERVPVPGSKNKCYSGTNVNGCSYTTSTTTTSDPLPNGIYYSRGDGANTPNQSTLWTNNTTDNSGGGMYIKGDVDQLKLCTNAASGANKGLQIIGIKQGSTTTTFQENSDGTWSVRVKTNGNVDCNASPSSNTNGSEVKKLSGKFNGMIYVDGDINDMRGDGSNSADLAPNSKLMVTNTGKVLLKDDITYVDMPSSDRPESEVDEALKGIKNNVLGIYSSGEKCEPTATSAASCGSILADGENGKDLNIHASIMATKEIGQATRKGEGFGAVRNNINLGTVRQAGVNRKVQIKLFGGVIERQSQTVGDLGNNGYTRNYKYDKRFKTGFAPPFFPEQAEGGESAVIAKWTTDVTPIGSGQSLWQTVRK